ncbi:hypothetical protein A2215_02375 [Candidatus Berkelbacteria bacterium RIFOXYA2_FULL_43_10]|uniref:Uncharacterized protein n=1 Tax=Candidatus Berkelbacteria bacterium RIFOXYA2_FULL_43_10 TaxID=1797472 RepID=A0A1F5E5U8_9BACT|nr:MAG: hypothetical protein A2215_02375 [Candidatus Berkelbacteria bacterium RIFOXYA2_FULL_43_10]
MGKEGMSPGESEISYKISEDGSGNVGGRREQDIDRARAEARIHNEAIDEITVGPPKPEFRKGILGVPGRISEYLANTIGHKAEKARDAHESAVVQEARKQVKEADKEYCNTPWTVTEPYKNYHSLETTTRTGDNIQVGFRVANGIKEMSGMEINLKDQINFTGEASDWEKLPPEARHWLEDHQMKGLGRISFLSKDGKIDCQVGWTKEYSLTPGAEERPSREYLDISNMYHAMMIFNSLNFGSYLENLPEEYRQGFREFTMSAE